MSTQLATFPKGGVHPPENKDLTNGLAIETMPYPTMVSLFLKQHVGAPCQVSVPHRVKPSPDDAALFGGGYAGGLFRLLVERKDRVREGDRIGEIGTRLGAVLHASVSGTVLGWTTCSTTNWARRRPL